MGFIDYIIIVIFLLFVTFIGVLFSRKASGNLANFFLSGRNLPWWLAGTSMLAVSFSCDTPLHVTKVIREEGLSGAWFYWQGILGGLLIVFLFAKFWRRTEVVTDPEFLEMRYAGKSASFLRFLMALFRIVIVECITLGWVLLGMIKIIQVIMDLPPEIEIAGGIPTNILVVSFLVLIALFYSAAAGLWGVVAADFIEFIVAMTGAIILMIIALIKVGGTEGLKQGIETTAIGSDALNFFPSFSGHGLSITAGVFFLTVAWWSTLYSDGSGEKAQRLLASRDEKNAIASSLWNTTVQYVIRNWPWFITALCSLILIPDVSDHELVYPLMIKQYLPAGLKGLMVASFFAAFLSTIDTHFNLTSSYVINDVYKRFLFKNKSDSHYVFASRICTVLVGVAASIIALNLTSVLRALQLKTELFAGIGIVLLLRWFWWRINAFSEISAVFASIITCIIVNTMTPLAQDGMHFYTLRVLVIVGVSFVVMTAVTFLTKPVPLEHLAKYYSKVRPPSKFWKPVAELCGSHEKHENYSGIFVNLITGIIFVFSLMISTGNFFLGSYVSGAILLLVSAVSGYIIYLRVFKNEKKNTALS